MAITETATGDGSIAVTAAATGKNCRGLTATSTGEESTALIATASGKGSDALHANGEDVGIRARGTVWHGIASISDSTVGGVAVLGEGWGTGAGVKGTSKQSHGVYGLSEAPKNGWGVFGEAVGSGVVGVSKTWIGVYGETHAPANVGAAGVWGDGKNSGDGVKGVASAPGKAAVCGFQLANNGPGVFGQGAPAGHFQGDVRVTNNLLVDGDITLSNADCAEDFDVSDATLVEPGTVMVVGEDGALHQSHQAYDKRVAGVISGAGDYKPGIVLDKQHAQPNRKPIALLGKVYCRVDAGYAPIEVGDLLTTAPTPGHAMKATDPVKAFGAVIGKALRPLKKGQGLIPILIALQ